MAAAPAVKDRPSTKAQVRYVRLSASKARAVLELIRGKSVAEADDALALSERDPALVIQKVLRSAVANAEHNDGLDPEELFVSTCFADEGPTLRRFRPRARGRATRIRKRTCHITVIVSRYDATELDARREREPRPGRRRWQRAPWRHRQPPGPRGQEPRRGGHRGGRRDHHDRRGPRDPGRGGCGHRSRRRRDRGRGHRGRRGRGRTPTRPEADEPEVADEPEAEADEPEAEADEDLVEGHTKDELLALAEEAGVEVAKSATKAEIADAITVATASADEIAEAHTKDELLELAEKAGIEVAKSWTKPQIAEAIVASREDD